VKGHDHGLI